MSVQPRDISTGAVMRRAFRNHAASVAVVTSAGPGGQPLGLTVSSLAPVSLDPPSVSISINDHAPLYGLLGRDGARFTVNLLRRDQEALARRFAESGSDPARFDEQGATWRDTGHGPALEGALIRLSCETAGSLAHGTHIVVIANVTSCETGTGAPLLHYQRGYCAPDG